MLAGRQEDAARVANKRHGAAARRQILASTSGEGTVSGEAQQDMLTALATGGKRLMFGRHVNELSRMLPPPANEDVLHVVAEGRLLHGRLVAEQLAHAIHHRAHLTAAARPVLQLALHELLSNAIEHGNLGLSTERVALVNEEEWFETYNRRVEEILATPLGRIPVRVSCQRVGADLEVVIEDRGMGFNARQVLEGLRGPDAPTGRGLGLVFAMLDNRVDYTQGGRRVTFRLPVREREDAATLPNRATVRAQGKIMVVDDQTVNLRVAHKAFSEAGFGQVVLCQNPLEALERAREIQPDLMILDVMMPELDGYGLCAQLKADLHLRDIPVVFFTGYGDATNRTKGYALGAVDFITKPINPDELVARSETHLMNGMLTRTLHAFASRMKDDLERARSFQYDLLPSAGDLTALTESHGVDLATLYQGCETLAGDYWTILPLDATRLAICLVDFTGHGVIAALNTVQLHTLLHSEDELDRPAAVARNLNHHLYQLLGNASFATFMYGVLDTADGSFSYAGGGAPPVLVRRASGRVETLDCSGLPLGLDPAIEVLPRRAKLERGDMLVVVSDALTDSVHADGTRWGVEGLEKALGQLGDMPASPMLTALLDRFYATVSLPVADDLTALAVRMR